MSQAAHNIKVAPEDRISRFEKFIYGMGSLANDSQAAWIGQMVAILILGLGINPVWVGLIGCIPRIFDAIIDPIVGYSSDNARTRWGRRKPFILFGSIAAGFLYMLMFQLHAENGTTFNSWYFLIFQVLFFAAFTCYSIPWIALGYEMTPDYHERTSLQSWSRVFAQVPWLLAPWCWAIMFSFKNPETGAPDQVLGARTVSIIIGLVIMGAGVLPAIFIKERFTDLPKPKKVTGDYAKNLFGDVQTHLMWKAVLICTLITFITQFMIPWGETALPRRILILVGVALFEAVAFMLLNAVPVIRKLFQNIVITFKNQLFVKICATTFLIFNGFMLSSTFIIWVIFFYVFKEAGSDGMAYNAGGKLLGIYGTFSAICTVCVVSFIPWLSRKLGKRNAFFVTIPLSIVGYAMKWVGYNQVHPADSELWGLLNAGGGVGNFLKICVVVVKEHYLLLACAPLIVFGLGSLFTIILSIVGDVCDVDELETGERREGMFSAVYWWMVKLGMALASFIGGVLLAKTGFDQGLGIAQKASTLYWMRVFDVMIPIVTSVIAIFLIMTINDSEEQAHEVRAKLEARRGKV